MADQTTVIVNDKAITYDIWIEQGEICAVVAFGDTVAAWRGASLDAVASFFAKFADDYENVAEQLDADVGNNRV